MSSKLLQRGTILIPSGTSVNPEKKHLFVICNNTCPQGNQLLVPISTWTNIYCDNTCIIEPKTHPFINRKSYVFYRKTILQETKKLHLGLDQNVFTIMDEFKEFDFLPIKYGILRSKQTPRIYKKYAIDVIGINLPKK